MIKLHFGHIRFALESHIFERGVTQTVTYCHRGVGGVKNSPKYHHIFYEWPPMRQIKTKKFKQYLGNTALKNYCRAPLSKCCKSACCQNCRKSYFQGSSFQDFPRDPPDPWMVHVFST